MEDSYWCLLLYFGVLRLLIPLFVVQRDSPDLIKCKDFSTHLLGFVLFLIFKFSLNKIILEVSQYDPTRIRPEGNNSIFK